MATDGWPPASFCILSCCDGQWLRCPPAAMATRTSLSGVGADNNAHSSLVAARFTLTRPPWSRYAFRQSDGGGGGMQEWQCRGRRRHRNWRVDRLDVARADAEWKRLKVQKKSGAQLTIIDAWRCRHAICLHEATRQRHSANIHHSTSILDYRTEHSSITDNGRCYCTLVIAYRRRCGLSF